MAGKFASSQLPDNIALFDGGTPKSAAGKAIGFEPMIDPNSSLMQGPDASQIINNEHMDSAPLLNNQQDYMDD